MLILSYSKHDALMSQPIQESSVSGTVRSLSQPVQSMSHACIVQESGDHVIPASPSVRKTPHLSPY